MTALYGTPYVARCRKKAPQVTDPSKVRLAFLQPDIPQNLGTSIRLAACLGVAVDIIEPCGFPLTDKALRRAVMDYGDRTEVCRHDGWRSFCDSRGKTNSRLVLFSTSGSICLQDFRFLADDCLLFGRESAGAPDNVHIASHAVVRIPLASDARSLNVAMAAGIALWEALRQTGGLPAESA